MGEHWYALDGSPCYELPNASKGGMRSVTIRDARKLGLVPSVTTVLSVIAKPQLEAWKVRQGILAALTLTREEGELDDTYISRVLADSQAQAKQAADEGTRIHDAIECHYKGLPVPAKYRPHVEAAVAEVSRLFPHVTDWMAERSFSHRMGFGGKIDLCSPSIGVVIDFKGKDGDFTDDKKLAYDQHWQLAAYQMSLVPEYGPHCANVFVSRTHPGLVASHVWTTAQLGEGRMVFLNALQLWKSLRGYDPCSLSA